MLNLRLYQRLHVVHLAHVGPYERRLSGGRTDTFHRFLPARFIDVGNDYLRAFARERLRRRATDPGSRTGYERYLILEQY